MKEFLPSITVQKGFYTNNTSNNINNPHKKFFPFGNNNKNNNQKYQNSTMKYKKSTLINPNDFLIVSNANKEDVNSNKNNPTSITYYNRGFSENKKNNIHIKNILPETFYIKNNINKSNIFDVEKNKLENILLKSYNIKNMKSNNNDINIISKNISKNFQIFLPEVQSNNKIKTNYNKKLSPIIINNFNYNNNNNSNNINMSITNSLFKTKKDKNIFNDEKIESQNINIHPIKNKDSLAAIGFLDNNKNNFAILNDKSNDISSKKILSTDIKSNKDNEINNNNSINKKSFSNIKDKNLNLNNKNNTNNNDNANNNKIMLKNIIDNNNNKNKISKNNNNPNIKICPVCHKEKEINKYAYHISLHPSKILDWLYLGSYRNACDTKDIKNLGINYVLNCAVECKESFPPDVTYCHLKLTDRPKFKIINFLDKAADFINQAQINDGIILVHCQLGISRSTTCVISYFIKYMGYTAMNALKFIKQKRTQVMPNIGFLNQLKIYEKNHIANGNQKNEII